MVYLYYVFQNKVSSLDLKNAYLQLKAQYGMAIIVIILMPLNWFTELLKWKKITDRFQKISFTQAIHSIGAGIFIGLFTPNRLGELGGRMIHIDKVNRWKAFYVNGVSSLSQSLLTIVMGCMAMLYFSEYIEELGYLDQHITSVVILLIGLLLPVVLLWLYFRSQSLKKFLGFIDSRIRKTKELDDFTISISDRFYLLAMSALRYLLFSTQFVFLLMLFISDINWLEAYLAVMFIFFCTTIVPSGWISSLPLRTSFAFLIIDLLGFNGSFALLSSVLLWIINLFIPACLSLLLLGRKAMKINTFKR